MATKTATFRGSNWVFMAAWAALVAAVASYFYSRMVIRKVNVLIEGLEHYVEIEFPRRE